MAISKTIIPLENLTDADVKRSLHSALCPACGGVKETHQTFCRKDYFALPKAMRSALYMRIGCGYRQAVIVALEQLGRDRAAIKEKTS